MEHLANLAKAIEDLTKYVQIKDTQIDKLVHRLEGLMMKILAMHLEKLHPMKETHLLRMWQSLPIE